MWNNYGFKQEENLIYSSRTTSFKTAGVSPQVDELKKYNTNDSREVDLGKKQPQLFMKTVAKRVFVPKNNI